MEPLVLLDTNVILAKCLDPAMDAKGKIAEETFTILSQEGLRPAITESVQSEFETKLHHRVGQIVDVVRRLSQEPNPFLADPSRSGLEVMENLFARLRKDAPDAPGALQLLETRLITAVGGMSGISSEAWTDLLGTVAVETSTLLSEIQRRFDSSGVEVLRTPSHIDHELFREIVPKKDLEHISSAHGLAKNKKSKVLFVTLESPLHAARDKIAAVHPDMIVTTPAYLRGQIQRLRGSP